VYVGDGLEEVVSLVDDDDTVLEVDADRLPGGGVEEGVVGQHHYLAQGHGRPSHRYNTFQFVLTSGVDYSPHIYFLH
jgi:hypothetical protein